jgi:ribosome maturation factor RimP
MDKAQDIAALVDASIAGLGLALWGVEYAPRANNSLVRLYMFDVNDPVRGQYTLEVSSPGLDRPFFRPGQMQRFLGETVEATLHSPVNGRRRFQGAIAAVDGERIVLDTADGRFEFDFGQAAKLRIKPDYARLMGTTGRTRDAAGAPGDER